MDIATRVQTKRSFVDQTTHVECRKHNAREDLQLTSGAESPLLTLQIVEIDFNYIDRLSSVDTKQSPRPFDSCPLYYIYHEFTSASSLLCVGSIGLCKSACDTFSVLYSDFKLALSENSSAVYNSFIAAP